MNKKVLILIAALAIVALIIGVSVNRKTTEEPSKENATVSNEIDQEIRAFVIDFGTKLKNVSLLMSPADVRSQMQTHYGAYLAPELLSEWQADPANALGRSTSSPWPEKIDVVLVTEESEGVYKVEGNVIEVTSADKPNEPAAVYPVTLVVEQRENEWRIVRIEKGAYSELPRRVSVIGYWECLPHKNQSGPQTLECAYGVAVDQSDAHYALDLRLMARAFVDYRAGTKIRVEGIMTPSNELNADFWQKYPIDGIISATSIEEVQ